MLNFSNQILMDFRIRDTFIIVHLDLLRNGIPLKVTILLYYLILILELIEGTTLTKIILIEGQNKDKICKELGKENLEKEYGGNIEPYSGSSWPPRQEPGVSYIDDELIYEKKLELFTIRGIFDDKVFTYCGENDKKGKSYIFYIGIIISIFAVIIGIIISGMK